MSINESQQSLPLSQITLIKLQQDLQTEPAEYSEKGLPQFKLNSQKNNQTYLNNLEKQQQNAQQQIYYQHNPQNQYQQDQAFIQKPSKKTSLNNQGQISPVIIKPNENQYLVLVQGERDNQLNNILTTDPHTSNCFIPQRQAASPNQLLNNEERFNASTPVQEIQSFYLNHNNSNINEYQIPDQSYNNQYDNRTNFEQQNQIEYNQQQPQEENLVQKLCQLSHSTRSKQKSQENNHILLQSNFQSKEEQLQNQIQQSNKEQSLLNTIEDDGNSILQRLKREEQFQQEIQNLKQNKIQQQKQFEGEQQNQGVYDTGIGAQQFDEIEMLVQRENFQNQLFELNEESELLYNEALQFINITKQKDQEMDKELLRQKKQLEDFRRKINEMKSTELTSGLSDGNDSIFLKKMDLQKLLFKIEDLKLQAHEKSRSQSPTKKGQMNEPNRSYYQNSEEKLKKKIQMNPTSSQVLQQYMNGKNYLSPKNYLEITERILGNPNKSANYSLTPPRYKLNATKIGNRSTQKQQQGLKDSLQQTSKVGSDERTAHANRIIQNFNNQLKLSQQQNTQGNTSNPEYINSIYSEATPKKNSNLHGPQQKFQSDFKQNQNEIQQDQMKSFSSNKKSTTASFFQYSPLRNKDRNFVQNFLLSPGSNQGNQNLGKSCGVYPNKFEKLDNHIFLVQSKTVNSPIISLLGKDRLVVARPFKGTLQKTGSNRVITDGDTYQFEHINMLVNQITKTIRQEILIKNSLDNHYKNIFIIGTKSSQKKTIQLDVLQLLKETFRTKALTMISNNYSCRIKLRYHENIFENPTTVSKLPTTQSQTQVLSQSQSQDKSYPIQDDISIDFNPLDPNVEDKILIFDEAISRIAKLIIDDKKSKIPQSKTGQLSQLNSSLLRSKIRTLKLSLLIFSNAVIVCKQSYRISTSNYIINPERRTPTQIFKESFHVDSMQQLQNPSTFRSFIGGASSMQNQQSNLQQSPSIGFKDETVFSDDNMVIFSCAPILKYFEQVRALFKSAYIFEKYFRKLNKQV